MGAVAVLVLALATAAVYPQVSEAADSTPGILGQRGWGGSMGVNDELLAEALGISVEELQTAREEAAAAAVDQAVESGLITEAQAEQLQEQGILGRFGGFLRSFLGRNDSTLDQETLLAEALGVTVEELQAAQETAQQAALDQAVEEGRLTQEQAEQMQARQALQPYLSERLQTVYAEAVQQALEDGAITQEQADQLLEDADTALFWGRGDRHGLGGRGGMRGPGRGDGFPGRMRGGLRGMPNDNGAQSNSGLIAPAANF